MQILLCNYRGINYKEFLLIIYMTKYISCVDRFFQGYSYRVTNIPQNKIKEILARGCCNIFQEFYNRITPTQSFQACHMKHKLSL